MWHLYDSDGSDDVVLLRQPRRLSVHGRLGLRRDRHARPVPPVRRLRLPAQLEHAGQRRHLVLLREPRRHPARRRLQRRRLRHRLDLPAVEPRSTSSTNSARTTADSAPPTTRYDFGNPGDKPFVGDFDGDGRHGRTPPGIDRPRLLPQHAHPGHRGQLVHLRRPRRPARRRGLDRQTVSSPPPCSDRRTRRCTSATTNSQGNADSQFTTGQQQWLPVSGNTGTP